MSKTISPVEWLWDLSLDKQLSADDFEKAMKMYQEQIMDAQMAMFHELNLLPYGMSYLSKRDDAEKFAEDYFNKIYK